MMMSRNPTPTTTRRRLFGRRDCIPARTTFLNSSLPPWRRRSLHYYPLRSSSTNYHYHYHHELSSSSLTNLFHPFISQLDLVIPPQLLIPLTTALLSITFTLYYYTNNPNFLYKHQFETENGGEWTLFTSPTPFYRFLKLRCASLPNYHHDKEDTVTRGPINYHQQSGREEAISYQRICINSEEEGQGGVISLDWPSNLDLELPNGLDTTILIVPGMNTLGSADPNVISLVSLFLKQGCFPIVMNPRGCARSPLTTPRLFTPADSDDISTAIHFINRLRPWTTLMSVASGYGANMLTRYLAQVGDRTPLTAAICLDNPFHLKHPALHHPSLDHNLTNGFIHILQSNKELFQGRSKEFDVEKALQSKCVQDFEEAISMVSYGFNSIKEFYVSSSTTDVIGNIMIPVLFVQNSALSSSSIPRSSIAKNPFTSLLVCTFRSDDKSTIGTSAVSWCQHLVVEWLIAVELGLLKGRHPLVEETDLTINPSKQLKRMATQVSHASSKSGNLPNHHQLDALEGDSSYAGKSSSLDLQSYKAKKEIKADINVTGTQTNLVDSEADVDVVNTETGKALQATEVVINMLDVTMPNTLSEEQKHKVLTAVGQGETILNALQVAVPEDVRGKLTSTVTAIMQNQKKHLNKFSSDLHVTEVTSTLNSKIQDRSRKSNQEKETSTLELNKGDTYLGDYVKAEEGSIQSTSDHGGEISNLNNGDLESNQSDEISKEKSDQTAHLHDPDSNILPNISNKVERSVSSQDRNGEQVKLGNEGETKVDKDNQEKDAEPSTDEKNVSTPMSEEALSPSASSPEKQLMTKEDAEDQKKEESSVQPIPSNSPSTLNVSQALDALTGMDDSTQVAVNSVFSVIEDVITQLEGSRDDESSTADKNKVEDVYQKNHIESESDLQQIGDGIGNMTIEPKELCNHQQSLTISKLPKEKKDEATVVDNNHNDIQSRLLSNMKHDQSLDLDATMALFLDYVPEEGKWELLEQSRDGTSFVDGATSYDGIEINVENPLPDVIDCKSDIIEPSYVILDDESDDEPIGGYKKIGETNEKPGNRDDASGQLLELVRENILSSLKVQVCRRIESDDMVDMAPILKNELEQVANTISLAAVHDKEHLIAWEGEDLNGPDNLQAQHMLEVISSAVEGTRYMKQVIPVGIVVGSSLASLRKVFNISAANSLGSTEVERHQITGSQKGHHLQAHRIVAEKIPHDKVDQKNNFNSAGDKCNEKFLSDSLRNDTVMAGAVTAALGASALLVNQQGSYSDGLESSTTSSMFSNQKKNDQETGKLEEETSKSSDQNVVASLAEKAMSVASPVVPTKEGGEVDQERLVALLADLGQNGGILKLVGKVALLWGGMRGAMSLIVKLFSFLRLAERPLFQRILGFVFLVLVLWTPVVVPLLPTLVQNNSSKYAELACIVGLYSSIMVLVMLWGKRIRGYEDPLERYGIKLTSPIQIQNFICGLIGGVMLVFLIQSTNVLLGFVSLYWPTLSSSTDAVIPLKLFGEVLMFVCQGLVTAIAIALVEELLFRSWLAEEIATDLGYNQAIILSGLAFSLSQWSLKAIPGLWLLSLGLAGVRHRCKGSIYLPIGLRAGIMASSFVLKRSGCLIHRPTYPLWLSGGDPFQPFNSIVGLAVAILWAVILYPKDPHKTKGTSME